MGPERAHGLSCLPSKAYRLQHSSSASLALQELQFTFMVLDHDKVVVLSELGLQRDTSVCKIRRPNSYTNTSLFIKWETVVLSWQTMTGTWFGVKVSSV